MECWHHQIMGRQREKKKGDKKDHQELTPVLLQTRKKKQRIRAQDVHM
jgi:hypothetical protein